MSEKIKQPQSTHYVAGEQEPTVPVRGKKETKSTWSEAGTKQGLELSTRIASLMNQAQILEDQGDFKGAQVIYVQVDKWLEKLKALREEEKAKLWDRERLVKWAEEQAGKDEQWVDKKFALEGGEIEVGGYLNLKGCTALQSLPDNLSVGGSLDLMGCTALQSLPDNLSVGEWLNLKGCTALQSLPDNLSVGGGLNLERCTALKSLPDNLSVAGDLYLNGCTALKSLPDNLSVAGDLHLDGCTALQSLPDNLSVGFSLYLNGCTALQSLPDNLLIKKNIYLSFGAPESLKQKAQELKQAGKIGGRIKFG